MMKKIICGLLILYSGWCFADNVNLEISEIEVPNDLTQIPSFLTFESGEMIEVPIIAAQIKNTLNEVNAQVSENLQKKYANLKVIGIESGIVTSVTNPDLESQNSASSNDKVFNADYVLYGQLSNFNSFVTKNQIDIAGQNSLIYHLNLAIHYQLLRISDKKLMADFIALGNVGSATIKSISVLPDSQIFLPVMTSSLYSSVYDNVSKSIDSKGIMQTSESTVN